jgi:hypothetical protein
MAHTEHHGPVVSREELAKMGYETRDIALNTLSRWCIGLFVFIGVATFGTLGLYKLLVPTYAEIEHASPLEYVRNYPPNPQLQARPKRDIIEYRAAEEKIEKNYTKGDNGTVNLPIDRAIDLLAERGISGVKGSKAPDAVAPVSTEDAGDVINSTSGTSAQTHGSAGAGTPGNEALPGPAGAGTHTGH